MGGATSSDGGGGSGDPLKDKVRAWKSQIRSEERGMDRQIRGMDREEAKIKKECKMLAKKGQLQSARILAKEIAQNRKAKERMYQAKAQLNSVSMQVQQQFASIRMVGAINKSTEVMQMMSGLVKIPEIRKQMFELSKEMSKAGYIDEMVSDALDEQDDEIEEAADEEIDKVLLELTSDIMVKASSAPTSSEPATAEEVAGDQTGDADIEDMRARLNALKE